MVNELLKTLKFDISVNIQAKLACETVLERSCNDLKDCSEGFILKLDR